MSKFILITATLTIFLIQLHLQGHPWAAPTWLTPIQLSVLTLTSILALAGSAKADLLDKIQDWIEAVQNTKANIKQHYNQA